MDIVIDIINNFELSENTIKNYKSQFKTIHNTLSTNDSLDYLDDIELFIHYLETFDTVSSKRTKASVISKIMQSNPTRFSEQIIILREYLLNLNSQEVIKPLKIDISLRDIKNIIKDIEYSRDKLILMLVTNHPVLRGDYNNIKVRNYNVNTDNYFDGHRLVFNKLLKVDKKVDPIILNATEILLANIIKNTGVERLYNYESVHGFNKYLRNISLDYIGYPYGIQHYRRLYTSTELNGKIQMDEKARNLARNMNHSTNVQSKYYLHKI